MLLSAPPNSHKKGESTVSGDTFPAEAIPVWGCVPDVPRVVHNGNPAQDKVSRALARYKRSPIMLLTREADGRE